MSKIGNNIVLEINGESHDKELIGSLYNFPINIKLDLDYIKEELSKRRPNSNETKRVELDEFEFVSGIDSNYVTNGETLTVKVFNKNFNSNDYNAFKDIPRPGHGDWEDYLKHGGDIVKTGGGSYSGRITVLITLLGSICKKYLNDNNIFIDSFVKDEEEYNKRLEEAIKTGDSIGGFITTIVKGLPHSLGDHWFDSIEGSISKAIMSIHSIKGIMFGAGLDFGYGFGSSLNDELTIIDNNIKYKTNHAGGISGGITTGEDLIFTSIVKPTPSIYKTQHSVNVKEKKVVELTLEGRFDPSIVRRVMNVINNLTAFVILDNYLNK